MRGCRPLTIAESKAVFEAYSGRHKLRNQCLHMLCITTGLRVSEALSLCVGDVIKKGKVVRRVKIARANMKRKKSGRTVELVAPARTAVERQLQWLLEHGHLSRDQYLFRSQAGDRPILAAEAWKIFNAAAARAGIDEDLGTLGTHSWRKTFADQANKFFIYQLRKGKAINPMLETSRALDHKSVESTERYISFSLEMQSSAMKFMEAMHNYA